MRLVELPQVKRCGENPDVGAARSRRKARLLSRIFCRSKLMALPEKRDGWDTEDRGFSGGTRASSLLVGSGGEAGAGHSLAESSFIEEVFFKPSDLLVEQIVGLVDQADDDIGDNVTGAGFKEFAIGIPRGTG